MRETSRSLWIAAAALSLAALAWSISWETAPPAPRSRTLPTHRISHATPPAIGTCGVDRSLPTPSDQPVQLTCWQAKAVAAQARENLAQPPPPVDPKLFAATTLDWLDPHGLWSAPPDSPVGEVLRSLSPALLASLKNDPEDRCKAAENVGARLASWVDSLRVAFDEGNETTTSPTDPWTTASETVFEDGPVRRPAMELAVDLGRRTASLQSSLGAVGKDVHDAIRLRMFPKLSPQTWGQVVLAAAVRSYVLLIDAHGAWAPMDEETSLYEVELEASGRRHLWGTMTRTAAGLRVDDEPLLPLIPGDVILAIGGVSTGGLSVEQAEQLGILDPNDPHPAREVLLLRRATTSPQRVIVAPPPAAAEEMPDDPYASVQLEQVPYGRGHVVVLKVLDVPDDLGLEMASALAEARLQPGLEGVVLDLRGNRGGSIEGAKEALAPFLPGAPLFPMRRRDGTVELESAPVPARTDHFSGPVAALVDPDTASAAEMIAGALSAYDRGVILGARTYGKGCAQEYIDDNAGVGVLRLSTLVYALPDGRPVQKVGLRPDIRVDFGTKAEREDALPNAMAPWRGPDIRLASLIRPVAWPAHAGHVGPCQNEGVCKALRALGLRSASARAR